MRNAFIALLVVNLVYFLWAHGVDEPKPPPVNEALAKLPRLKLVSELPPEQRPATNTRTATIRVCCACRTVVACSETKTPAVATAPAARGGASSMTSQLAES